MERLVQLGQKFLLADFSQLLTLNELVDKQFLSGGIASGVKNVECDVEQVGNEFGVTLSGSTTTVLAERFLLCKLQEQQFAIMHRRVVSGLSQSRRLLLITMKS